MQVAFLRLADTDEFTRIETWGQLGEFSLVMFMRHCARIREGETLLVCDDPPPMSSACPVCHRLWQHFDKYRYTCRTCGTFARQG